MSPAEHFSKGLAFMNLFTPSNLFRYSYHFIIEGSEIQKLTPESELGSGKLGLAQGIWYMVIAWVLGVVIFPLLLMLSF